MAALYTPPRIRSFADVRAAVEAHDAFRVKEFVSDGGREMLAVDYSYVDDEAFLDPLRRECRGLVFDAETGGIAARPLHKFFNLGERVAEDAALDFSQPHTVAEKLDGVLFFPAVAGSGELVWCTRAGRTELAREIESAVPAGTLAALERIARETADGGDPLTPSAEFTGPQYRIVIDYPAPQVRLLAVRGRVAGRYLAPEEVADRFGDAPAAGGAVRRAALGDRGDFEALVADVAGREGEEGVVVAFDSGHRVKIKARTYVLVHKAKYALALEKNVLHTILAGRDDDVAALLGGGDAARLRKFAAQVRNGLRRSARRALAAVERDRDLPRGEFAGRWGREAQNALERALGFRLRSRLEREGSAGGVAEAVEDLAARLLKSGLSSQAKIDANRVLWGGARWNWDQWSRPEEADAPEFEKPAE